jgi:TolA-binding protein
MLMDWRLSLSRWCVASAVAGAPMLLLSATPLFAADAPAPAPAAAPAEVDAGTKQLMAANGLFQRGLYKLAGDGYRDFLAQNPKHEQVTAARYALAVCDYKQGQYAAAIEPLQAVLKDAKFDQRDEALRVLGYCQLAGKSYTDAAATFSEILTKYPQSKLAESAGIYRMQALYLGEKPADAAKAAADFIAHYPKSVELPTALYFQALAQRALGKNDAAAASLDRLTKEYPDSKYNLDATLLYGQTLEALGKLDPAIAQYRRMLAAAPEARKADAHFSLGVALYKVANYPESAKELAAVVDDFPTSQYAKDAKFQLGLALLASGKTAEARRILTPVAKDDVQHANDAAYGLAQCDIADKKFDSAYATLDQLAKQQPAPANLQQILLDRAVCLMEQNKFDEAAAEFAAFATRYPDSPQTAEAMYRQAYSIHRLEKYDVSHAICQRVLKLPKSAMTEPAAELDAENLFLLAKYPEAEKAFSELSPDTKDQAKLTRFKLRIGQCEYFAGNYAKAAELLKPVADSVNGKTSDEAQQAEFLLGDALLQQGGQEAAAMAVLKKYLASAKGDQREARYKLALAQVKAEDEASALKTLTPLIQGPADDAWVQRGLLEAGQLNYNAKKSEPAAAALNKLLSGKPLPELVPPATYLLGWIDFDAKHFADAADKWKTVAATSTDAKLAANAAFQQAVALKEAGKTDEAVAAAFAFAASHPEKADATRANQLASSALYDLAWQQRQKKDDAAAIETYRKMLKIPAETKLAPAARTELAELLYNDKKYAEAADFLEAVIADKSAEAKVASIAAYKLGWCYEKLGKNEKAAAIFSSFAAATSDDPKLTPSALLEAGMASAEQGKYEEAEKPLTTLLAKFPDYEQAPVGLLKLGEVQAEQNEYTASAKAYQTFLEKYPKNEFAYRAEFGLGWAMENQKKYEDARSAYKKVIAASNGEFAAHAQFQIGETLLAEQKFEPAIKELLAVEDVYNYPKWSAPALFDAGRAFEQLKQPAQAKQQYTTIITKYKDTKEAALAQERIKAM